MSSYQPRGPTGTWIALGLLLLLPLLLLFLLTARGGTTFRFGPATTLVFASAEEGRSALEIHDEYVDRMSAFDRSARLHTARAVGRDEYLRHATASVRDWEPAQRLKVRAAFDSIAPAIERLGMELPDRILLVRSNGAEEGDMPYSRGTVIVLPDRWLGQNVAQVADTAAHQLFHVYSRTHADRRPALYGTIGYRPCGELEFPPALADRKITNPDAPRNDYCVRATHDGHEHWMMPITYAVSPYDEKKRGEFYRYVELGFLHVGADERGEPDASLYDRAAPELAPLSALRGYAEQIGKDTRWEVHPEEILADHFVLLVMDAPARTPERIEALREELRREIP